MSREYGQGTLYFGSSNGATSSASIDLVIIGSLSYSEEISPRGMWCSKGDTAWPQRLFQNEYPSSRVLIIQKAWKPNDKLWVTIQRLGGIVVEILDKFRQIKESPLVICCHGLGGYVFMKALETSNLGDWNEKLVEATSCAIFLGTPLNYGRMTELQSLLRSCATTEVGLQGKKVEKIGGNDVQAMSALLSVLKDRSFAIMALSETKKSRYGTGWGKWGQKIIVDEFAALMQRCTHLAVAKNHVEIADLDDDTYKSVSKFIEANKVKKLTEHTNSHSKPLTNLSALDQATLRDDDIPQAKHSVSASTRTDLRMSFLEGNLTIGSRGEMSVSDEHAPEPPRQDQHVPRVRLDDAILKTTLKKIHKIPYPENYSFVGREATLQLLSQRLIGRTSSRSVPAFALWGAPGQGKTQTALKFTYENQEHFDYIIWVIADREQKLLQNFSDFAVALGLREKATNTTAGAKALLHHLSTSDAKSLLVFDNAEDPRLINEWWPHNMSGSVLITARNHVFATSSVANYGHELGKLNEDDAVDWVLQQVPEYSMIGNFDKRKEARKIVNGVQRLPLGIQACIGLINELNCSLEQYNDKYHNPRAVLRDASGDKVYRNFAPYPKGPDEVFKECVQKLNADARALLEVFALLDPDNLQINLLDQAAESDELRGLEFVKNRLGCIKSLSDGLIARNSSKDSQSLPSFHVHRLLQHSVQMNMDDSSRQRSLNHAAQLLYLALKPNRVGGSSTDTSQFKEYFPHAQSLHDFYKEGMIEYGQKKFTVPIQFVTVLRRSSWLCYRRSFFNQGLTLLKTAEVIIGNASSSPTLSESVASTVTSHNSPSATNLTGPYEDIIYEIVSVHYTHACIATEIGHFTLALTQFQCAKTIFERAVENGYEDKSRNQWERILGGIANSLNGLGRDVESEKCYIECLQVGKPNDIHSAYEVNICRSRWARGLAMESEGDLQAAKERFEVAGSRLCELIARREAEYGENDTRDYVMGHMLYVLGNVRISESRHEDAFDLHQRALKCWRSTLGEEHHKTGDAWHKYGWHLAQLKRYSEAGEALKSALGVYRSGSDENFRQGEIARTTYKLGVVYAELNLKDESAEKIRAAEELRRGILHENYTPARGEADFENLVSLWAR